ncbi:hypothetical protein HW555_001290 [Spodoptera exigua]|uniref:RNase H type-1 domain-containing protein n=1 Tax=Spodoptera exigua TaxID=7107 RepID=A0A835LAI9_SPOEX|nr:hypothetical protein HW555_001290 [Spodoptera exigua]
MSELNVNYTNINTLSSADELEDGTNMELEDNTQQGETELIRGKRTRDENSSEEGWNLVSRGRSKLICSREQQVESRIEERTQVYVTCKEPLPKQFALARLFKTHNIASEKIYKIKYVHRNKILVTFDNEIAAEEFIKCSVFSDMGWSCQKTSEVGVSYGLIRAMELDISDEELKSNLSSNVEIVSIKRLNKRCSDDSEGNGWTPSETIRLGFQGPSLPPYVYIYSLRIPVERFVFPKGFDHVRSSFPVQAPRVAANLTSEGGLTYAEITKTTPLPEHGKNGTAHEIDCPDTATTNIRPKPKRNLKKPRRPVTPTPTEDILWHQLSRAVAERRLALANLRRCPSSSNLDILKEKISTAQRLIRIARCKSFQRFCSSVDETSSASEMWRKMRWLKNRQVPNTSVDKEKAERLLKDLTPDFVCPPQPTFYSNNDLLESPISMPELVNCIKTTDTAPGSDQISFSMIKQLPLAGKQMLLQIYNQCFSVGFVPKQWRQIKVVPIPKHGSSSSYRPISLISCICKILHAILAKRIEWFFEKQGLFPEDMVNVSQYADDFVLYSTKSNLDLAFEELRSALRYTKMLIEKLGLTMSSSKTKICVFKRGCFRRSIKFDLDGTLIDVVNNVKYLGLWLDSSLRWGSNYWQHKKLPLLIDILSQYNSIPIHSSTLLGMFSLDKWTSSIDLSHVICDNIPSISKAKRHYSTLQLKQLCSSYIQEQYPDYHTIFTDGSKANHVGGAAFLDPILLSIMKIKIDSDISSMHIELIAILEALSYILSVNGDKFVILTDSKSSLQHLARNTSHMRGIPTAYAIYEIILRLQSESKTVCLQWIPSHVQFEENDRVDMLAKQACVDGVPMNVTPLFSDYFRRAKNECFGLWQEYFDERSKEKGIWYRTIQPEISRVPWIDCELNKTCITIALRLRSGHTPSNKFNYLMRKVPSPCCDSCGVVDDVLHILMECARNENTRLNIFGLQRSKDIGYCNSVLSSPMSDEAQHLYKLVISRS